MVLDRLFNIWFVYIYPRAIRIISINIRGFYVFRYNKLPALQISVGEELRRMPREVLDIYSNLSSRYVYLC